MSDSRLPGLLISLLKKARKSTAELSIAADIEIDNLAAFLSGRKEPTVFDFSKILNYLGYILSLESLSGEKIVLPNQSVKPSIISINKTELPPMALAWCRLNYGDELFPSNLLDKIFIEDESPVKVIREYRQMEQEELAHKAGISANMLGQVESGKRKLAPDVTAKMAEILHFDKDLLAAGAY